MTHPPLVDLQSIILPTAGLGDTEIESLARSIYSSIYLHGKKVGELSCHDSSLALFHETQFEHAFFTSRNRAQHLKIKDSIARDRIERIHWIGPVIAGRVSRTACYDVIDFREGNRRTKRLYLVQPDRYVVWLEPRSSGGWKFSTAYLAGVEDLRRYCKGQRKIWIAP